jgi:hypothetical protein
VTLDHELDAASRRHLRRARAQSPDPSAEEVIASYRQLMEVERAFRVIKLLVKLRHLSPPRSPGRGPRFSSASSTTWSPSRSSSACGGPASATPSTTPSISWPSSRRSSAPGSTTPLSSRPAEPTTRPSHCSRWSASRSPTPSSGDSTTGGLTARQFNCRDESSSRIRSRARQGRVRRGGRARRRRAVCRSGCVP